MDFENLHEQIADTGLFTVCDEVSATCNALPFDTPVLDDIETKIDVVPVHDTESGMTIPKEVVIIDAADLFDTDIETLVEESVKPEVPTDFSIDHVQPEVQEFTFEHQAPEEMDFTFDHHAYPDEMDFTFEHHAAPEV